MQLVRSLLLSLGLLILGTGLANAHDGYAHEAPPADDQGLTQLSDGGPVISHSCPGVPGKFCCCGTLSALSGTAKAGVVVSGGWTLRFEPKAVAAPSLKLAPASHAAPLLSPARTRAPPKLS